jgi:tetratricopeptide (TPR) repeat protein
MLKIDFSFSFRLNEDSTASCSDKNIFCIWYYDNDLSEEVQFKMKNRLIKLFTYFHIFNDLCKFAEYLTRPLLVTKIYFIITSKFAECLCNLAQNRPQDKIVYQFQPDASSTNTPLVFTDFDKLFMQISKDLKTPPNENQSACKTESSPRNCHESILPPPCSIWNSKITENSFRYWKKESPEFFKFQALIRFLTRLKCDPVQSLAEMIAACRQDYINNTIEVHKIDDVENNYKHKNPIWFYTNDSFLFRSVGRAFRSEDFERIFLFRRYIFDLHWALDEHARNPDTPEKLPPLYRGKKLSVAILQQLQDNVGNLISMNGFLSTTYNRDIAIEFFAGVGQNHHPGYESVLFEFVIDEITITEVCANISSISQFPLEKEVLFTIGSIWRIDSVENYNGLYWIVKLSSCNDVNLKIIQIFEELTDDRTLLMLGDVLRELEQHTQAENIYYKMLDESTVNDETRATLYYNIAMINMEEGKYPAALRNLQEAEKLISSKMINAEPATTISQPLYCRSIVRSPIHIYNNMGRLYQKKGDAGRALEYYIKALSDENSDPIDKATVYDNIGLLHYSNGKYIDALKYLSEAVKLAQDNSSLAKFTQDYDAVKKHLKSSNASFVEELHDPS